MIDKFNAWITNKYIENAGGFYDINKIHKIFLEAISLILYIPFDYVYVCGKSYMGLVNFIYQNASL